jgi:hypothetical protein
VPGTAALRAGVPECASRYFGFCFGAYRTLVIFVFVFVLVQIHLSSSQLFVFWLFLFLL